VAGVAKNYSLTPDYVLHEMSYANMILYSSVIPSYDDLKKSRDKKQEDGPKYDERLDANNPKNFTTGKDREVVKR
jgi:hypothetical protein